MFKHVRNAYFRTRQPLAYALILIAVGLSWVPAPELQTASLVALLTLITQILFEVHDAVAAIRTPRSFEDFFAAQPLMREYIQRSLDKRATVSIRGLGMTLQHAWPLLETMLLPALDGGRTRNVHVELAVIDPNPT